MKKVAVYVTYSTKTLCGVTDFSIQNALDGLSPLLYSLRLVHQASRPNIYQSSRSTQNIPCWNPATCQWAANVFWVFLAK